MTRFGWVLSVCTLALAVTSCGGNPLVGSWQTSTMNSGTTATTTVALNGDGSASFTVTASGTCTGTFTLTGYSWTSTADTITWSGTGACAGMWTCSAAGTTVPVTCNDFMSMNGGRTGACTYVLGNNDMQLTLSNCSNGSTGTATTYTKTTAM